MTHTWITWRHDAIHPSGTVGRNGITIAASLPNQTATVIKQGTDDRTVV